MKNNDPNGQQGKSITKKSNSISKSSKKETPQTKPIEL